MVFLDDDVSIEPDLFGRLAQVYLDPSIVGVTGQVIEPQDRRMLSPGSRFRRLLPGGGKDGTFTRYGYPRYLSDPYQDRDVEFMRGCFMSARRDAAREVRFDEHLGGYALAEDEDFSYRLSRLGRIRYVSRIVVEHRKLGFGSADARGFDRRVVVNRAYLFKKNFEQTPAARAEFALLVAMLVGHRILNREWRGAQGLVEGAAGKPDYRGATVRSRRIDGGTPRSFVRPPGTRLAQTQPSRPGTRAPRPGLQRAELSRRKSVVNRKRRGSREGPAKTRIQPIDPAAALAIPSSANARTICVSSAASAAPSSERAGMRMRLAAMLKAVIAP